MDDTAWVRDEEAIEAALARGEITLSERNKQLADISRDYREAAEEAAWEAYEAELRNW